MTEAYILNWQEEFLHLTIKHYQQFCDRITIYDNYSTDGSDKRAKDMGCHVIKFGIPGQLSDAQYLRVKNHCWKNSTADWVIVCDADEILYHKELKTILHHEKEASIFKTQGINIYSERLPEKSFFELSTGYRDDNYSKSVLFNPKKIRDIRYSYGAHKASPSGIVEYSREFLYLLHYRNIGGPEKLIERHALYRARMSEDNKRLGLGCHYLYDEERRIKEWHEHYANCTELSQLGISF